MIVYSLWIRQAIKPGSFDLHSLNSSLCVCVLMTLLVCNICLQRLCIHVGCEFTLVTRGACGQLEEHSWMDSLLTTGKAFHFPAASSSCGVPVPVASSTPLGSMPLSLAWNWLSLEGVALNQLSALCRQVKQSQPGQQERVWLPHADNSVTQHHLPCTQAALSPLQHLPRHVPAD